MRLNDQSADTSSAALEPMRASETDRGIRWISNFDPLDQPTARLLLDAVELVGQDDLRAGLSEVIHSLPASIARPITLVPVRELQPGQAYFGRDRNARAPLLNANSLPGSEGTVATLLNGIRRQEENAGPFTAAPSLRNMRDAKTRSIVFVDDLSGSGDRILKFRRAFHRHPTLRSWKSYQRIEYHVVVYAATRAAHERLERSFGKGRVHTFRVAPSFTSRRWRYAEQIEVEDLCRHYKYRHLLTDALGHRMSRGLLAFSHTAPNNLPPVLWQTNGRGPPGGAWEPFFVGKVVPPDLEPLFAQSGSERRIASALTRMASQALLESLEQNYPAPLWRRLLLVLLAVQKNPRNDTQIAELTELSLADTLTGLATARNAGLLSDVGLHLTDQGRAELRHAHAVSLPIAESGLKPSSEPYYPRSLRVRR